MSLRETGLDVKKKDHGQEMVRPTLLILAAGIGSRYGGIKQMDQVGPSGECLLDYSVYDAIRAGFGKVVFVISRSIEQDFKAFFGSRFAEKIEIDYVFQDLDDLPPGFSVPADRRKPWGTGHAILSARNAVRTPFAAINADDFYGASAYRLLADFFQAPSLRPMDFCMVGYRLANTLSEHGSVSRGVCRLDGQGHLQEVVERTAIERREAGIGFADDAGHWNLLPEDTFVSLNFWGFTPDCFPPLQDGFAAFLRERGEQPKAEYFIPSIVSHWVSRQAATVRVLRTEDSWFGVTYREDKPLTVERIRRLVDQGVYPENLWA